MESIQNDKNNSRSVYTIVIENNKTLFKLGRGHESDLRINDISVSRYHVVLKYIEGKFYLEDQNSKFGTLILMKDSLHVQSNWPCSV